jgi:hypothetical protein
MRKPMLVQGLSIIEQSAIETLQAQGWAYLNGKDISPEGTFTKPPRFSKRKPNPKNQYL